MATGSVNFTLTDLRNKPIDGKMRIDLTPGPSASGGQRMVVEFLVNGHDDFTITDIVCRGGAGTLYEIRIFADGYRPYAFFQMIQEGKNRPSESHIRLMVNPKKVARILPPPFGKLPATFRAALERAKMTALAAEDRELVGLTGQALYDALGSLRQACMLNLVAKAMHPSAGRVARFVQAPTALRQDRCFAIVSPEMPEALRKSSLYKSAPSVLHEPPPGFVRRDSFKTRDAHGNLQVT
ncbi:MAG: hypothetical protein OEW19_15870, partial [Acidobacteriota bacterium]|nr:hypothetical protein [Acidobacteriota bacterium]